MDNISTTVFINDNGDNVVFDFDAFNRIFRGIQMKEKLKVTKFEEILAQEVGVSTSAVHNWRNRLNGPSDKEMIKKMATRLKLSSWESLTKKVSDEKGECMARITDKQMESLKMVYDAALDFLDDFEKTDGFTTTLWYKYKDMGVKNPEDYIWEYAERKQAKVELVLEKEYFYLHSLPVYKELETYVYDDLLETYNGKLGYAYRFEALVDGNPTTSDDYMKALNRIREIMAPYA